jgi:hypothetical protein
VGWSILLDFLANSKRLTERERELAIQGIASENLTVKTEDTSEIRYIQALEIGLRNWRTRGLRSDIW